VFYYPTITSWAWSKVAIDQIQGGMIRLFYFYPVRGHGRALACTHRNKSFKQQSIYFYPFSVEFLYSGHPVIFSVTFCKSKESYTNIH